MPNVRSASCGGAALPRQGRGRPVEKSHLKQKNFCDDLFFKFSPAASKATAPPLPCKEEKPLSAAIKIRPLADIKKEVLQSDMAKKLNVPWNHALFARYRLDKADWTCLISAWQADLLSRDLLFGTLLTERHYQRLLVKDKKRLLMLFHPDKHSLSTAQGLYSIIFKKINTLYLDYQDRNNK